MMFFKGTSTSIGWFFYRQPLVTFTGNITLFYRYLWDVLPEITSISMISLFPRFR